MKTFITTLFMVMQSDIINIFFSNLIFLNKHRHTINFIKLFCVDYFCLHKKQIKHIFNGLKITEYSSIALQYDVFKQKLFIQLYFFLQKQTDRLVQF